VIAVSGSLGKGFADVHQQGIDAVLAITSAPMTLDESTERAFELVAAATGEAMRLLKVGSRVFGG
jgi:glycerate kinase